MSRLRRTGSVFRVAATRRSFAVGRTVRRQSDSSVMDPPSRLADIYSDR